MNRYLYIEIKLVFDGENFLGALEVSTAGHMDYASLSNAVRLTFNKASKDITPP